MLSGLTSNQVAVINKQTRIIREHINQSTFFITSIHLSIYLSIKICQLQQNTDGKKINLLISWKKETRNQQILLGMHTMGANWALERKFKSLKYTHIQ